MLQTEERYCENSLKAYRDIKNSLDSAEEKGRAEGFAADRAEEKASVAKKLLSLGVPIKHIAEATNLTIDEIEKLQY